jgi:hypothetical protein
MGRGETNAKVSILAFQSFYKIILTDFRSVNATVRLNSPPMRLLTMTLLLSTLQSQQQCLSPNKDETGQ